MGGGGHMSQMQAMLKNNRRTKKRLFDTLDRYVNSSTQSSQFDLSIKATPEQLAEIRERLQKENKQAQHRKIVFVISAAVIGTLLYLIFNFVKL